MATVLFDSLANDPSLRSALRSFDKRRTRKAAARWRPRRLSAGHGALELLANILPARARPERALAALRQVVVRAQVLKGERGEAEQTAGRLLEEVERGEAP